MNDTKWERIHANIMMAAEALIHLSAGIFLISISFLVVAFALWLAK